MCIKPYRPAIDKQANRASEPELRDLRPPASTNRHNNPDGKVENGEG